MIIHRTCLVSGGLGGYLLLDSRGMTLNAFARLAGARRLGGAPTTVISATTIRSLLVVGDVESTRKTYSYLGTEA
ncbi:uncharacterized protein RAG0_01614 [Rhynchosporium agropyri]|uniref:Uncharacterized protein n=1 Tax=Rhynchosporium agropyri TaxID=914238 RepID=A0A1E1JXP2_9HELO|nr:uncharacterized protein RAG0_01614 [Rhynchosporium agropyri]